MQVTIQEAKNQLRKLIEAAQAGEEVIITDADVPVAKLVAIPKPRPFQFDILKDELEGPIPDFLEPIDEKELALWEGGD